MLSFGLELELSDVDRRIDIPKTLGYWEGPKVGGYYMGAECSIANTNGKAVDPLCRTCKVGGEINTRPSYSIDAQLHRVLEIFDLFPEIAVTHVNHQHCIVKINEKITRDLIKNIFRYTQLNEVDVVRKTYWNGGHEKYFGEGLWKCSSWGKWRLRSSGGRMIHPNTYNKIFRITEDQPYDITHLLLTRTICIHPDTTVGNHKSPRSAINLVNIQNGVIEFRCFRATLDPVEIYSQLMFAKRYVEEAMKGERGLDVKKIFKENKYSFAPLRFDEEIQAWWEQTKHLRERGEEYKYWNQRNCDWSITDEKSDNKHIEEIISYVKEVF